MANAALPYRPHNHATCVSQALDDARAICKANNARLTPVRERVLELIWQSHKPLGAYDVLAALAEDGHNAAPPTVYRALDFLLANGLVHRIASLNAFVGCAHAGQHHNGMFLICRHCHNVLELTAPAVASAVAAAAAAEHFVPEDTTIEIAGRCPNCRQDADNV